LDRAGQLTANTAAISIVSLAIELASAVEQGSDGSTGEKLAKYSDTGFGPTEFCSAGFVHYILMNLSIATLPTNITEMMDQGEPVMFKDSLPGDLLFFDLEGNGVANHVGINLGGNLMAHAANEVLGVTHLTKLTDIFWLKPGVFIDARRLVTEDEQS